MAGNGANLTTSRSGPVADFTSLDYDGMKADVMAYVQEKYADRWTDFNQDQLGVVLLEALCYLGDLTMYQINASVRELYGITAIRRENLRLHAALLGIDLPGASAATTDAVVTLDPAFADYPFTIRRSNTRFSNGSTADEVFFTPTSDTVVSAYGVGVLTIPVQEGEYFDSILLGVSNGSPNQRWQFPQDDVLLDSVTITVGASTWTLFKTLAKAGSADDGYKLVQDEDGHTFAVFGDGVFGVVPSSGAAIRATFRSGGGTRGNVVVSTVVDGSDCLKSVTSVRASGGRGVPSMKESRYSVPSALSTQDRVVNDADAITEAKLVSGVAKAKLRSRSFGRYSDLIVAPSGGGVPSRSLRASVAIALTAKSLDGTAWRVFEPVYKNVRMTALLYVNQHYRASDVEGLFRVMLSNIDGTGILDFDALDFGAVVKVNEQEELLISTTRMQGLFAAMSSIGLDRVELQRMDVQPQVRFPVTGNAGNGTISDVSVLLSGTQRRREYYVLLTSSAQAVVYERILGRISSLGDSVLYDDTKQFDQEGISSFNGYFLYPQREGAAHVVLSSASGTQANIIGVSNLFTMANPGDEYVIFNPIPINVNVGGVYTSPDGSVQFQLTAGGTPFLAGDSLLLDVYPVVGDVRLRDDEYPQLTINNLITRTSGGTKV